MFDLPPTDQLIERLRLFFGSSLADQLIWVESESNGVRMWGYIAHPSQNKPSRKWQHLFLNGRWFQDRSIQHALSEAYRGLLMVGRQPICFLSIDMSPSMVDVNVHPTKIEVRFVDSQQLYRQLLAMLRTKFLTMNLDSVLRVSEKSEVAVGSGATPAVREMQTELSDWVDQQVSLAVESEDLDEAPPPVTTWSIASERARPNSAAARMAALSESSLYEREAAELPETPEAADAFFSEREGDAAPRSRSLSARSEFKPYPALAESDSNASRSNEGDGYISGESFSAATGRVSGLRAGVSPHRRRLLR